MPFSLLTTDRYPVVKLEALDNSGNVVMDLTPYLMSSTLKFTDELISHEGTFTLSNSDGNNNGYFDKYGNRAGSAILVENRLLRYQKGFLDPTNSYTPLYYPAFIGRIASVSPGYDRTQKMTITVTAFDLLKLSLSRKFTSDPYYNTQLNQIAQDLILRYGDSALQLFGSNYATLNYLQSSVQFPDMTLIDCISDIYGIPIYQFWVNYAGQPETFPKLGSSGTAILGYPDATSAPTPDFTFPDGTIISTIGEQWQDHTFNNQVQVRGVSLGVSSQLGPSQLLGSIGDPINFDFLAAGQGARPRVYYSSQTGNSNQLTAQNVFLKLWDPSFNNDAVNAPLQFDQHSGHLSAGPYKYIASGPNITNDVGQIIPFPVIEAFTNFPAGCQGVSSIKSDGTIEGGISVNVVQNTKTDPLEPLSPLPSWPPNFVDLFLWANTDGGGFEYAVQVYGQPVLTQQQTLTAIADYDSQLLTETLKDEFGDHQTYQGTKVPWAMGTPIEVVVNPSQMPNTTLSANFSSGVSIITVSSSGSSFLPPTTPSIYSSGTTPAANVIAIGTGSTREYAIVSGVTSNTLTLSSPLQYSHLSGEIVNGLTGVISYDDIYQSLLFKGDWDRGRVVFNNQVFRPFSADELSSNSPGPSSSQYTYASPTINITAVQNPAPQAVYQSARVGVNAIGGVEQGFSYTFTGLTVGYGYLVRLHFTEPAVAAVGSRVFDILINGADQQTGFDITASAGGYQKAYIIDVTGVNCEPDGSLKITFQNQSGVNSGAGAPIVSGIEILYQQGQGGTVYAVNCGGPAVGPSPSTTLSSSPLAGSNTFTLTSVPSGFAANSQLQIGDNSGTLSGGGYSSTSAETVTVQSIVGSTVTIVGTLKFNHSAGANVYLLPTIQSTYGWSQNQQTYGPQALIIDDPLLQTLAQCQARAKYEVNKAAWQRNQVNLVTASIPTIKPGQVIKWFNPQVSTNGTDFWGYVQSITRLTDRSNVNNPIDNDTYSVYLLYVQAR